MFEDLEHADGRKPVAVAIVGKTADIGHLAFDAIVANGGGSGRGELGAQHVLFGNQVGSDAPDECAIPGTDLEE